VTHGAGLIDYMPTLTQIPIARAWKCLGGGEIRKGRSQAFWRDGDAWSVSLDAEKNAFFDFVAGQGGGVLALTETALGCDKRDALAWLRDNCALETRHATAAERAAAQRQQREAEAFEERLMPSYRAFLTELTAQREVLIQRLRVADDPDLKLELQVLYWRIDNMRAAIGDDCDADAVAVTTATVRQLELAERNRDESTAGA
jgi:hypothetical protein